MMFIEISGFVAIGLLCLRAYFNINISFDSYYYCAEGVFG
jgi:hypothetical protein